MYRIFGNLFILLLSFSAYGQHNAPRAVVVVEVCDSLSQPLAYATVSLHAIPEAGRPDASITDTNGKCRFSLPAGRYRVQVSYVGYASGSFELELAEGVSLERRVRLRPANNAIREVVITASEVRGAASGVRIGQEAMQHLQPSSFEDLLELLPGGRATDPTFGSSNQIHLREVPTSSSNYDTSSLGVAFVMDGVPMSNDAAMQYQTGLTQIGDRVSLNTGIDLRTLPTDEISSVEIVQGIPSVEYGDLTSGLVKIHRKEGSRNLEARFKADLKSQLYYIGKGFEWGAPAERLTMNVGLNWLDARADPRNTRQNYRRMTASWRMKKRWEGAAAYRYALGGSVDYTGSFDRVKSDKNIDEGPTGVPIERYRADYNSLVAALNFSVEAKQRGFFRSFDFSASLNAEFDRIDRWRYVVLGGNYPIRTAVGEGVYDAEILPDRYEATLRVDGKPFYANAKGVAQFEAAAGASRHKIRVGAEWNLSKNYGGGLLYDVTRPISDQMRARPRRYDALPALHRLSAFAEDHLFVTAGEWRIEAMAGLRTTLMANLGSRYTLQGRCYFDPRANLSLHLPSLEVAAEALHITLSGGVGWHTKTPTLDQLFPDPVYADYMQLNYYPADASKRRVNMVVYKVDPTNYSLTVARNFKWEVRSNLEWAGYGLSVTYFREDMTSGFRTSSRVLTHTYLDYDESAIDGSTLTGPPSLEGLPYTQQTVLETLGTTTNGSRTLKQGVEFTLTTRRIRPLATKLIVSGAYFRTRYRNSEPQYIATSVAIDNKPYPYIGLYAQQDNYLYEVCNTNFLLDTQIPRLGLIFSTSLQCQWFAGMQSQWCDPRPMSYLDKELHEHAFTDESAADGVLQHMIRPASSVAYLYRRTPFSMYVNLKISKRLYRERINASLFVNRLFDYSPSYYDETGGLRRRYSSPYFGMELNFKL